MWKTKLTATQRYAIRDRARAGEKAADLAAEFGISVTYVYTLKGPTGAPRGFGGMDPERHRAIASLGGRRAHELGRGHEFTIDEAREAGRKGGRAVSRKRDHMVEIGRVGGKKNGGKRT